MRYTAIHCPKKEARRVTRIFDFLNCRFFGAVVPLFLLFGGVFLAVRLKGFFILHPIRTVKAMLFPENGDKKERASGLRALAMALAGTLGVGNISGVALALMTGGAGALFFMWLSALFAMALKYGEVTLAVRFRPPPDEDGPRGGAMYYIRDGLHGRGHRALAAVFAVLCLLASFFIGSFVQVNAIGESFYGTFHLYPVVTGVILTIVCAWIVFGGTKKISAVTARLVPAMTAFYIFLTIAVLVTHMPAIPGAVARVFREAATPQSACGGIAGFLFSRAVRIGCARGIFSNEAGCGTAPMAHATGECGTPMRQGLFGIAEVFIDTFVLSTLTGLAVLVAVPELDGDPTGGGVDLINRTVATVFGRAAPVLVAVTVFVFAFATVICWAHYAATALRYFTRSRAVRTAFLSLYSLSLTVGTLLPAADVFVYTDTLVFLMTGLNTAVLLALSPVIATESKEMCAFSTE